MEVTAEQLIKRQKKLKAGRANHERTWDDITKFIAPHKMGFVTKRSNGEETTEEIYDSTAPHAAHILASSIHSTLTSPKTRWFGLRFRSDDLNEDKAAKEWIEGCAETMIAEINDSTFDSEVNELYADMIDFSLSLQLVEASDKGGLRIQTMALADCVIAEDKDGKVDTVFRSFRMTARQIEQKWKDHGCEKVTAALEKDPDKEFEILHAVFPREGKDVVAGDLVDANRRPWAEFYVLTADKKILEEGGHYEFPYMVPRWAKRAGDVYGFCPSMLALPEVKTLNRAKYLELSAWEGAISPPLKAVFNDIIGDIDQRPNGITNVRDLNAIGVMNDATNWNTTMMKAEESRQMIRDIYYSDQLVFPDIPNATAYEMSKRYELMQKLLGSTFGRIVDEYLDPFIQRVFNIMYRQGKFEDPPESLAQAEGDASIDIEYVSPLARAQKMEEVESIQAFAGFVYGLDQQTQDPIERPSDVFNTEEGIRRVGKRLGVPADSINGEDEVAEIRDRRRQQMQQMMAAQGGAQGGAPTG